MVNLIKYDFFDIRKKIERRKVMFFMELFFFLCFSFGYIVFDLYMNVKDIVI